MNYWEVYTFDTFFAALMIVICIVFSALFNTYIFIKVRKSMLLWKYLLVQGLLFIWLAGKIMELVAPTVAVMSFYLTLEHIAAILLVPAILLFIRGIARYNLGRRISLSFGLIFIIDIICITYVFLFPYSYAVHFAPSGCFLFFNGYALFNRQRIFAELSEVSLDVYMEEHEDAVVIFDRSGNLMDFNQSAGILFGWMEPTVALDYFLAKISESIVSGKIPEAYEVGQEPAEIGLEGPLGLRYYLFSRTIARNRKNMPVATVLSWHDVSRRTVLLQELEQKNTELDRLNSQLKNYLAVAARLEEEKEKNRVFLEIQETIGARLAGLIGELERMRETGKINEKPADEKLAAVTLRCRELMFEIRLSVNQLMP